jgi:hypothetical protein
LGLWAVGLGIAAIVGSLFMVMQNFQSAADVGAVLGLVTAPIGTMVAAYFGVQAGSAGKEKADENAKNANEAALRAQRELTELAAVMDPAAARTALHIS